MPLVQVRVARPRVAIELAPRAVPDAEAPSIVPAIVYDVVILRPPPGVARLTPIAENVPSAASGTVALIGAVSQRAPRLARTRTSLPLHAEADQHVAGAGDRLRRREDGAATVVAGRRTRRLRERDGARGERARCDDEQRAMRAVARPASRQSSMVWQLPPAASIAARALALKRWA